MDSSVTQMAGKNLTEWQNELRRLEESIEKLTQDQLKARTKIDDLYNRVRQKATSLQDDCAGKIEDEILVEDLDNHTLNLLCDDSRVMEDWKKLARALNMRESNISEIQYTYRYSLYEQCYQMLRKWKTSNGRKATVSMLVRALRQCNLNASASHLNPSPPPYSEVSVLCKPFNE